jgi:hypothetical protein
MLRDRFFGPATLALAAASLLACGDRADLSGPVQNGLAAAHDVDVSLLVPLLSPTFTNWKCVSTGNGPVCSGDRLRESGWAPSDFPCALPVYSRFREYRTQTRYHDEDYLNYFRRFHQDQAEYFSLSPTGDGSVVLVDAHNNWTEAYVVPGDDQTRSIETSGLLFKLKDVHGGVLGQWAGQIIEAPGEDLEIKAGNVRSRKSLTNGEEIVPALCSALGTEVAE